MTFFLHTILGRWKTRNPPQGVFFVWLKYIFNDFREEEEKKGRNINDERESLIGCLLEYFMTSFHHSIPGMTFKPFSRRDSETISKFWTAQLANPIQSS